jgi:hypothetical protein
MGSGYGANIKPDGTYEITSTLPVGEYIVTIDTEFLNKNPAAAAKGPSKVEKAMQSYRDEMAKRRGVTPVSSEDLGTYVKIPEKYRDKAKSDLKVKLTRGKNKEDFNLTD